MNFYIIQYNNLYKILLKLIYLLKNAGVKTYKHE